jgi:glycine C-acetyltransferase
MSGIDAIIPKMIWDVEHYKERNLYFHMMEVGINKHGCAHVKVEDYGDMILLCSYSYLGLIGHPEIQKAAKNAIDMYGTGTHGVRLLAGTLPIHHELEEKIAQFKNTEAAIAFSSGYVANVSTISCLLEKGDVVICDKFDHSSIIDGCLLSRAELKRFKHNDMNHLEYLMNKTKAGKRVLVVVDAVFSMDGDIINLPEVKRLCEKYNSLLMVDEAHAIGVLGATGRGIEEHFCMEEDAVDIKMGTLSKTIPSIGGYIAGSKKLIAYLTHSARGFVYSASLPAPSVAASIKAFDIIINEPNRVVSLKRNYEYFAERIQAEGFDILNSQTAIIPIICGSIDKSIHLMKYCLENGIFIQAIYPPVVPVDTSRLRATVNSDHTRADLDYCVETLKRGAKKIGIL